MTKVVKDVLAGYDFYKVGVSYWTRIEEPKNSHYSSVKGEDLARFVQKYNEDKHAKFTFYLYDLAINGRTYSNVCVTINEDRNNSWWTYSTMHDNSFTDAAFKAVMASPKLNDFIKGLDLAALKQNRLEEILNRFKEEATNRIIAAQSVLDYLNN